MKSILALVLIGVACATALPTCLRDDFNSCFKIDPRTVDESFMETEEYLDNICEQFSCALDYKKKCGHPDDTIPVIASFKHYEKVFDAVCEKHTATRRKYLENVRCLNRQTKEMRNKCQLKELVTPNDPRYCRGIADYLFCIRDVIWKECGKVAGEVYDAVAPVKEFFQC